MQKDWQIIGLMSGTSLDGLDLAHVGFCTENEHYSYQILFTETFEYPMKLRQDLKKSIEMTVPELLILDKALGRFSAECVQHYLSNYRIKKDEIDVIASHGHTVHHRPDLGFTQQIGCGATLSFHTGIKVVNDFRTKDVVAGGQGAPLVPIGDKMLFGAMAEAYLNIGGICNVSFQKANEMCAFDICPGNLPLNLIVSKLGKEYDDEGKLAKSGKVIDELFEKLNNLIFYKDPPPKSLGVEWLNTHFYPLITNYHDENDLLRTIVEHEAVQIANVLNRVELKSVLLSGGGAKNDFLLSRIHNYFKGEIIVPDNQVIDFKEALIFAFLGLRYLQGKYNCLKEVTGSSKSLVGGALHIPD
jgi:anhydro-N-acetylmuramic acid kinase